MEVTITSIPSLWNTDDPLNPDAMEFRFQQPDGTPGTAHITGNFGYSMPLTEAQGDTVHLEYELEGYWDDEDASLYHISWDQPPDDLRGVGTTPEQLAEGISEKARKAAYLAQESAMHPDGIDPGLARYMLRLMAHHLQDLALDAEAMF